MVERSGKVELTLRWRAYSAGTEATRPLRGHISSGDDKVSLGREQQQQRLAFAWRQTVQARAPRTTGALELYGV